MPESLDLRTNAVPAVEREHLRAQPSTRSGVFEWSLFGLFAVLLALITSHHEMWRDEMQAWLIVRDNPSLRDLFHLLRYEGHPALWYLLLYIPARISWNPVSMQVINYVLAVAEAWLILSARKLHWTVRALAIWSFFVFYEYGAVARSYMLAMLLLTAATRCFVGERQHRKLGILFLALAMNTHVLAIPTAAAIAVWAFCFSKVDSWKDAGKLVRDSEFRVAFLVLIASLGVAYLTVRPAPDVQVTNFAYDGQRHSMAYNLLLTEGRIWKAFIPIPPSYLPGGLGNRFEERGHISAPAVGLSLLLFLAIAGSLRTKQARYFFLAASTIVVVAIAATIHDPTIRHCGMVFAVLIVTLLLDAYVRPGKPDQRWFPRQIAVVVISGILILQALPAIGAAALDWRRPFSDAKAASLWLKQQGLDENPLVIDGAEGLAVVGYMERPYAYQTSCACVASYQVLNRRFNAERTATARDLALARGGSPLPVVVVHSNKMDDADARRLGLTEVHAFAPKAIVGEETFVIYEQQRQ